MEGKKKERKKGKQEREKSKVREREKSCTIQDEVETRQI